VIADRAAPGPIARKTSYSPRAAGEAIAQLIKGAKLVALDAAHISCMAARRPLQIICRM
jgi:hypothetical protein